MSTQKPQNLHFSESATSSDLTLSGSANVLESSSNDIVLKSDAIVIPSGKDLLLKKILSTSDVDVVNRSTMDGLRDDKLSYNPNRILERILYIVDAAEELKKDDNFQDVYRVMQEKSKAADDDQTNTMRDVVKEIEVQLDEFADDRHELVSLYTNAMLANGHKELGTQLGALNNKVIESEIIKKSSELMIGSVTRPTNLNDSEPNESLYSNYLHNYSSALKKVKNQNSDGFRHVGASTDPYTDLTAGDASELQRSDAVLDAARIAARARHIDTAIINEYNTGVDFIAAVKESVDVDLQFAELRMRQNWLPIVKTSDFVQFFGNGSNINLYNSPSGSSKELYQGGEGSDILNTFSEGDVTITIQKAFIKKMHDAADQVTNDRGITLTNGSGSAGSLDTFVFDKFITSINQPNDKTYPSICDPMSGHSNFEHPDPPRAIITASNIQNLMQDLAISRELWVIRGGVAGTLDESGNRLQWNQGDTYNAGIKALENAIADNDATYPYNATFIYDNLQAAWDAKGTAMENGPQGGGGSVLTINYKNNGDAWDETFVHIRYGTGTAGYNADGRNHAGIADPSVVLDNNNTSITTDNTAINTIFDDMLSSMENLNLLHYVS